MRQIEPGSFVLAGASLVLPGGVEHGTVVVRNGRVLEIVSGPRAVGEDEVRVDLTGYLLVPGFIDVHVHGVQGVDVLDGSGAVARVAADLPRFGVTAWCPTSVACEAGRLDEFLEEVGALRAAPPPDASRVLGAHLESNFINPEYRGAQPGEWLRTPATGRDILEVIDQRRADVLIVTLAPEVEGVAALARAMAAAGVRVSVGHTGATYEQAMDAFAHGASQVTHLFNRMTPFSHRDPGVVGAALAHDDVVVELICDGRHVHPAAVQVAVAAKGPSRVMAITDATAGAGLPRGAKASLGGQVITVEDVARLADGTMAGSVLTMDRAFATLVSACGLGLTDAVQMCATTPARQMGLVGHGAIAPGAVADFAVLDAAHRVVQTWIAGRLVWENQPAPGSEGAPPPAA